MQLTLEAGQRELSAKEVARFWKYVDQTPACWPWKGATSKGRPVLVGVGFAHRLSWRIHHGPIEGDQLVKRSCGNDLCVRPGHLCLRPRKLGLPRRPVDPEDQRRWNLRKYGLTPEEYDRLLAEQGGVCAVCRSANTDRLGRRLHVDHCHDTGKVRGLLCTGCNNAIGHAGESSERLRALAEYVEKASRFPR